MIEKSFHERIIEMFKAGKKKKVIARLLGVGIKTVLHISDGGVHCLKSRNVSSDFLDVILSYCSKNKLLFLNCRPSHPEMLLMLFPLGSRDQRWMTDLYLSGNSSERDTKLGISRNERQGPGLPTKEAIP